MSAASLSHVYVTASPALYDVTLDASLGDVILAPVTAPGAPQATSVEEENNSFILLKVHILFLIGSQLKMREHSPIKSVCLLISISLIEMKFEC